MSALEELCARIDESGLKFEEYMKQRGEWMSKEWAELEPHVPDVMLLAVADFGGLSAREQFRLMPLALRLNTLNEEQQLFQRAMAEYDLMRAGGRSKPLLEGAL